jgi:long-subunit acyl-CoA synthetase (AMP-forming)
MASNQNESSHWWFVCYAKVVDVESKKVLGPFEQGEVWARGPQMMKGYLNNEQATRDIIDSEGWLHTGQFCFCFKDEGR